MSNKLAYTGFNTKGSLIIKCKLIWLSDDMKPQKIGIFYCGVNKMSIVHRWQHLLLTREWVLLRKCQSFGTENVLIQGDLENTYVKLSEIVNASADRISNPTHLAWLSPFPVKLECLWYKQALTHWGRVSHICVGNLIGSDNGLSPGRRQAIIWTNAGILLIGPLGTNFSEILIRIHKFSFTKMHLKMSSAKWRPFSLDLNVITIILVHKAPNINFKYHINARRKIVVIQQY